MALWQYCRETAHNAAVLRLSANVPEAPRLNSLFKPCAGQSVWRNLIRRHCRLHNDIARILLAGDGQFGELPRSLPKNACFGKSSSFATNARLKSRVHPKYIEVPCSPYAPQERLVAALCLTQCLSLAFSFLLPVLTHHSCLF